MKFKIIIPLLCFLLIFPYGVVFADDNLSAATITNLTVPAWFNQKKSELNNYLEKRMVYNDGSYAYYLFDFQEHTDKTFTIKIENNGYRYVYLNKVPVEKFSGVAYVFKVKSNGEYDYGLTEYKTTYDSINLDLELRESTYIVEPLSFKGINFDIDSKNIINDVFPPPPTFTDEGYFGYSFEVPSTGENINLHVGSSNSVKIPFRIKVKNFYALGTNKANEFITDNFKINNYKTEVTNITWEKKSDILGMSKYSIFYIDGFYYINTYSLPSKDTLKATIYNPSSPWIENPIDVTYSYDGSQPSYNPSVNEGTGGDINNDGNVNIGGTDYGEIPSAPVDGDIGDWFQYIGSLLLWLVTYPFKLLGQMVSTLTGYITNMFGILTPVTRQLNDVLSFVPVDILNVCWGFLSFTILYSVLKSVFKMIRG